MSESDFKLTSGASMHVSSAPFQDANELRKALQRTGRGIPLASDPMKMDVSVMKDIVLEAASSDDVERCLFKCLERCSYQNVKIDRKLFDDANLGDQARGDLFEIYWKCIEVNCGPFFVKIFSTLMERLKTIGVIQKSPVQQKTA